MSEYSKNKGRTKAVRDASNGVYKPPFGGHTFQTEKGAKDSNEERMAYQYEHARETSRIKNR